MIRMLRVLGSLKAEPESWRAQITNAYNREFIDNARIISAALRGHHWLSDGASAFEEMQVLSQSLINNIKEAPMAIVNAAAKIARKFMFWEKRRKRRRKGTGNLWSLRTRRIMRIIVKIGWKETG